MKTGEAVFLLLKNKNMEMMPNPYESRLNQGALEKQREKYINQELEWLLSDEGQEEIKKIESPYSNDLLNEIVEMVINNLNRKSGQDKNAISNEFTPEVVLMLMKNRGMWEEFQVGEETIVDLNIGKIIHKHPRDIQRWSNDQGEVIDAPEPIEGEQ